MMINSPVTGVLSWPPQLENLNFELASYIVETLLLASYMLKLLSYLLVLGVFDFLLIFENYIYKYTQVRRQNIKDLIHGFRRILLQSNLITV